MTHHETGTLAAAAAQGDDVALAQLVRSYHDRVYRYGLRVCRDGYDADDAVQEAFVKLSRRPDVARDPGVLSWLMTVVKHACMRTLRPFLQGRARLSNTATDDDAARESLDPQQAILRWELIRAVHLAIAKLARPYREVLIMRDLEGLTGPQTCEALGLDLAAMKTRLLRARKQLRDELTPFQAGLSSTASSRNEAN